MSCLPTWYRYDPSFYPTLEFLFTCSLHTRELLTCHRLEEYYIHFKGSFAIISCIYHNYFNFNMAGRIMSTMRWQQIRDNCSVFKWNWNSLQVLLVSLKCQSEGWFGWGTFYLLFSLVIYTMELHKMQI